MPSRAAVETTANTAKPISRPSAPERSRATTTAAAMVNARGWISTPMTAARRTSRWSSRRAPPAGTRHRRALVVAATPPARRDDEQRRPDRDLGDRRRGPLPVVGSRRDVAREGDEHDDEQQRQCHRPAGEEGDRVDELGAQHQHEHHRTQRVERCEDAEDDDRDQHRRPSRRRLRRCRPGGAAGPAGSVSGEQRGQGTVGVVSHRLLEPDCEQRSRRSPARRSTTGNPGTTGSVSA